MDINESDLTALIAAVALKDHFAFKQLYKSTSPKLFRIVLRICRKPADAEEVLQDVYVKIWNRAGQFQKGSRAMGWLATICKNQARDFLRARARARSGPCSCETDLSWVPDSAPNPEYAMIDKQMFVSIISQIERLDCVSATLVRSAYLEGHSYKELSDHHILPLNTVRTLLRRGLLKLRKNAAEHTL